MLFEPDSHEAPAGRAWDEERVRAGIRTIVADAEAAFDDGWADHPLDGEADRLRTLYMGGAGVVDAFRRLSADGLVELQRDYVPYLEHSAVAPPDFDDAGAERSLWMGEVGVRLVLQRLSPSAENLKRLAELVDANAEAEQQELMWGSPGTILIGRELGLDVDEAVDWLARNARPTGSGCRISTAASGGTSGLRTASRAVSLALADGEGVSERLAPVRDRRGRPDQLAARRRRAVPARAHAADPDAVVPRSARHRLDGRSLARRRSRARRRRAHVARRAAPQRAGALPRHRGQRLRAARAVRADGRRGCGLRAPVRSRCTRSPRSSARAWSTGVVATRSGRATPARPSTSRTASTERRGCRCREPPMSSRRHRRLRCISPDEQEARMSKVSPS